jgi:hypothetical protein
MAEPRSNMGVARVGQKVYFVGGRKLKGNDSVHATDVSVFDLATQTWSKAPPLANGRETAAVAVTGFVVAAGGFRRKAVADVELYVPQENKVEGSPIAFASRERTHRGSSRPPPFSLR